MAMATCPACGIPQDTPAAVSAFRCRHCQRDAWIIQCRRCHGVAPFFGSATGSGSLEFRCVTCRSRTVVPKPVLRALSGRAAYRTGGRCGESGRGGSSEKGQVASRGGAPSRGRANEPRTPRDAAGSQDHSLFLYLVGGYVHLRMTQDRTVPAGPCGETSTRRGSLSPSLYASPPDRHLLAFAPGPSGSTKLWFNSGRQPINKR